MDSLSKRKLALIKRYGSFEAYQEAAKEWGKKGGHKSTGGFRTLTFEQRSKAGKLGVQAMRAKQREELLKELKEEGFDTER